MPRRRRQQRLGGVPLDGSAAFHAAAALHAAGSGSLQQVCSGAFQTAATGGWWHATAHHPLQTYPHTRPGSLLATPLPSTPATSPGSLRCMATCLAQQRRTCGTTGTTPHSSTQACGPQVRRPQRIAAKRAHLPSCSCLHRWQLPRGCSLAAWTRRRLLAARVRCCWHCTSLDATYHPFVYNRFFNAGIPSILHYGLPWNVTTKTGTTWSFNKTE